ncbi:cytochrome P450 [Streptomyces sp. NPDC056632]|uniref:cytochrome P450 n=1 Tax=Streptomyces sp. NPDC056632 TaxID=3345884 RepID=UPI0036C4145F
MDDPYPLYRQLRDSDPVHFSAATGLYFLSRYEDVATLGRDSHSLVRGTSISGLFTEHRETAVFRLFGNNIFAVDEPDHGRLKRLFSRAFVRSRVERLVPRIEEICGRLIEEADLDPSGGRFDLIGALGRPLPFEVICELLGILAEDRDPFLRWTGALLPVIDPFPTPAETKAAIDAAGCFEGYFTAVIGERRRLIAAGLEPPQGLITDLVRAADADEGGRLTQDELISLCWTLLVAGYENVTNLISNAMRALCENPDQATALREDPELLGNLPDEALRHYSTTQYNSRQAADDLRVRGVTIPRGAGVILLRGAANRDDRQFTDPDRFDLRRTNSAAQVGFGEGATFCTGAALARIEVRIAFRELFKRFGSFSLTRFEQGPTKLFWGPQALEVAYAPAGTPA